MFQGLTVVVFEWNKRAACFLRPLGKAFGVTESHLAMPCLDLCPRGSPGPYSTELVIDRRKSMSVKASYIFFSQIPLLLQWVLIVHSVNLKLENKPEVSSLFLFCCWSYFFICVWAVLCTVPVQQVGRVSSVGIATRYGLDGPGFESRWVGEIFRTRPDRPWGPPSLLYNGYRVFPGGKAAGAWRWPPTPSSAEVKERVELYLYSTSVPSWPVMGWTLLLPLPSSEVQP
jgi:hypothetical protein